MKSNSINRSATLSAALEIVQSGLTSAPALRSLPRSGVLGLEASEASTLACVKGRIWVTREGDPEDYLLEAGENMVLKGHGRVVVQSLLDSSLVLG